MKKNRDLPVPRRCTCDSGLGNDPHKSHCEMNKPVPQEAQTEESHPFLVSLEEEIRMATPRDLPPSPQETREEFERDRFGETGERLAAEHRASSGSGETLKDAVLALAKLWREIGDNYSAIQFEHAARDLERLVQKYAPASSGQGKAQTETKR